MESMRTGISFLASGKDSRRHLSYRVVDIGPSQGTVLTVSETALIFEGDNLIQQKERMSRNNFEGLVLVRVLGGGCLTLRLGGYGPNYYLAAKKSGDDGRPLQWLTRGEAWRRADSSTPASAGRELAAVTRYFFRQCTITMAESRGLLKILSRPRMVTQNNIQAVVKQGVRIPIVTEGQFNGPPTSDKLLFDVHTSGEGRAIVNVYVVPNLFRVSIAKNENVSDAGRVVAAVTQALRH
jgi:hypothetical protein